MSMIYPKANREKIEELLGREAELHNLAREFHHAFGVTIGNPGRGECGSDCLKIYLDDLPVGSIGFARNAWCGRDREDFYYYSSRAVSKEKSSKRTGRNTRDASKITGLISAIKKYKDGPDQAKNARLMDFAAGIRTALNPVSSKHERNINVEVEPNIVTQLVEQYLGVGEVSFTLKDEIKKKHDEYLKKVAGQKELLSDVQRYKRGCKAIGILSGVLEGDKPVYATARVIFNERTELNYTEPLQLHETLSGTDYAADAAMIRTFMRNNSRYDPENEIGVGFGDHYYKEMDFSMGYTRRGEQWVLIPLYAE